MFFASNKELFLVQLGRRVSNDRFICSCVGIMIYNNLPPPSSCPSSWTVYWACSVPMWLRRTEPRYSKTLNCWRRSCRASVCAPVDFCCKHFLFIVVRNETLPSSSLSSRLRADCQDKTHLCQIQFGFRM